MAPQIHLIDETWIDAEVDLVSAVVRDHANWPVWWPTLQLTVTRDRGVKGMQWAAGPSGAASPALAGSAELWLEPYKVGVIMHHYLRLDPADGSTLSARVAAGQTRRLAWHAKRVFWQLKDELEASAR